MKLLLTSLSLLFLNTICLAQSADDIIGKTSKEEILNSNHKSWFIESYKSFKPKTEHLKQIKTLLSTYDYDIDVYFGTWCTDSQREVPRLIKILEQSQFNFDKLTLIGVNTNKDIPDVSTKKQKQLNITNVPTIIVYHNGKEVNRFVEYAQKSLEKDLIKILAQKPYKHSYQ